MAAPDRVQPATLATDINLLVNKQTDPEGEPNFVMVGCATSKDYGLSNTVIDLNCDSGPSKVDNGQPSKYDLQLTGFVFNYPDADKPTNVSAIEFEQWGKAKPQVPKQYKLSGKYKGDPVRTFWATIVTFRESGQNGEMRTYTVALDFIDPPVITAQV